MVHIYDHKGQHLPTYGPHLWKIQKDSQNLPDLHVHQCVMARWRGGGGGGDLVMMRGDTLLMVASGVASGGTCLDC